MKAFIAAIVALAVITVAADQLLIRAGFSSAEMYSSGSVRLGQ
jgi:hypothetical protein